MCGRYVLGDASWAAYHDALRIIRPEGDDGPSASFNICPTQQVAIAAQEGEELVARSARWGLVPHWHEASLKEWKGTTFNARIEEAYNKPSFRTAWRKGRCLVPASGYYEWTGPKSNKTPHYISLTDNRPTFFFAGLCSTWQGSHTCTILTRPALPEIEDIHHRMPVILTEDEMMPWLNGAATDDDIRASFGTGVEGRFRHHQVRNIGIRDNGPELIEPTTLF